MRQLESVRPRKSDQLVISLKCLQRLSHDYLHESLPVFRSDDGHQTPTGTDPEFIQSDSEAGISQSPDINVSAPHVPLPKPVVREPPLFHAAPCLKGQHAKCPGNHQVRFRNFVPTRHRQSGHFAFLRRKVRDDRRQPSAIRLQRIANLKGLEDGGKVLRIAGSVDGTPHGVL